MFIQTLLLQAPPPLVAFQLPLEHWITAANLCQDWFTVPAKLSISCCVYSSHLHNRWVSCNKLWYSRHADVYKRNCASIPLRNPIIQIQPWRFLKGIKRMPMIKVLDRVIHTSISRICLSLPVRPMPRCGFKAQKATHQNQSPSTGNVSGSCHRGFSNSSSVTSSFMKTSRSGL